MAKQLLKNTQLSIEYVMSNLELLSRDKVINVRISLAELISSVWPNPGNLSIFTEFRIRVFKAKQHF